MKRIVMAATIIAVVGFGSTSFSNSVQAETIHSERAGIKQQLTEADGEIADILYDLKDINIEIEKVSKALKENEASMADTKTGIAKTEEEITLLEEEIVKLEEAIEIRYEMLKDRISSYQNSGGDIAYLDVLFGSKNFNEFISGVTAVTTITNADAKLMEEQEADKAKVEENQLQVTEKLDEQKAEKTELEGLAALIKDQQGQNIASKTKLEGKETELVALKANLESKDSSLAQLEIEIRQEIALAATNDGTKNTVNGGTLTAANGPATSATPNASANTSTPATPNVSANTSTPATSTPAISAKPSQSAPAASAKPKPAPSKPSGGGGISTAINAGYGHLGTPYTWGGKSPSGFDCSGFVSWAYGQAGYSIPSNTGGLSGTGSKVSYSSIQPGDLVFFDTYKRNGHVGIYVGGGSFIGAQNSTGLAVANMTSGYWKDHFAGHVRRIN